MTISTTRGVSVCRGCSGVRLASVLDLGEQPLSNAMGTDAETVDPTHPLHLRVCGECGLGQLGEYVTPDRIFADDYPYFSSMSSSWLAHAAAFAGEMVSSLGLAEEDLVVEVASNDGYLLEQFARHDVAVLGVEPAAGVAAAARAKGVPTTEAFFGVAEAEKIVAAHGHPRLVVANNVMAHVPDLADFAGGLATLCGPGTIVTVENPSFVNLLVGRQFDTIYHEHFSYLTAHAIARAVELVGLELFRVDALPTHGGSNRYWLGLSGQHTVQPSVAATVSAELESGLLEPKAWAVFREESLNAVADFRRWLEAAHAAGRSVAGYGAAAKGNTLLNAAGATRHQVRFVVDGSPLKQGRFLPGTKIPVLAPDALADDIDDVLILPWNLAPEIVDLVQTHATQATCWTAIPSMQKIA